MKESTGLEYRAHTKGLVLVGRWKTERVGVNDGKIVGMIIGKLGSSHMVAPVFLKYQE